MNHPTDSSHDDQAKDALLDACHALIRSLSGLDFYGFPEYESVRQAEQAISLATGETWTVPQKYTDLKAYLRGSTE